MELPTTHRMPLAWLLAHGSEAIRYRTLTELSPVGTVPPEDIVAAQTAVVESKSAGAIVKKQKDSGTWGGNLLALAPRRRMGSRRSGPSRSTAACCRSAGRSDRARSSSPTASSSGCSRGTRIRRSSSSTRRWCHRAGGRAFIRAAFREAAAATLAESGHHEDPRLRGAAHKIADAVSSSSAARSRRSRS